MVFRRLLSRILLSMFVFSTSNIVVPTFASESSGESCKEDPFELWCGNYSFDEKLNPKYNDFVNKIKEDEKIFNDYGIKLLDIKDFYRKTTEILYNHASDGVLCLQDLLRELTKKEWFIDSAILSDQGWNIKFFCKNGKLTLNIEYDEYKLKKFDLQK